jgi:hypothetical protein
MPDRQNTVAVNTASGSGHAHLQDGRPPVIDIDVSKGTSTVIVGANGAGKTRLGVTLESRLGNDAHRIPAQRNIIMRQKVTLSDYTSALNVLHHGHDTALGNKRGHRWQGNPETILLDDFEILLRALFAQQNHALIDDHKRRKSGLNTEPPTTKLDALTRVWNSVLPHRKLEFNDASISVVPPPNPPGTGGDNPYSPQALSDGRAGPGNLHRPISGISA